MNAGFQHSSGHPARRGFTLLETLLVLGLMSMLAAVLVGGSANLLKGTARSDPEDALMALLQTIRRYAVEHATIVELIPSANATEDEPDFIWSDERATADTKRHEERLPRQAEVTVKILGPEVVGAILLGGLASESSVKRIRFYPDGTCDRMRIDISRDGQRRLTPIDPLTCAPLPAADAR